MSTLTRIEVHGAVEGVSETDEGKDLDFLAAERVRVEIDGRKQFFRLQRGWSTAIIAWISALSGSVC